MGTVSIVVENKVETIVSAAIATGVQTYRRKPAPGTVFQVILKGTGAVAATVLFEVSLNGTDWVTPGMATVTLSGTDSVSDGFASNSHWRYVRPNITAISGTGATIDILMGY